MILSGKMEKVGEVPGKETTVLEVPVRIEHTILLSLANDIAADWDVDYQLDLGLTIDLPLFGDLTIPLSWKGEIKLPTISSIFWISYSITCFNLMVKYLVVTSVFLCRWCNELHVSLNPRACLYFWLWRSSSSFSCKFMITTLNWRVREKILTALEGPKWHLLWPE